MKLTIETRLTLIKQLSWDKYKNNIRINRAKGLFKCDCGNTVIRNMESYKSGTTRSCGCIKKKAALTHGLQKHPLYKVWANMKRRCYDPKTKCYKNYGGNGVVVCDEWKNDFKEFYDWAMDNGYRPGLQLDKDAIPDMLGMPAKFYGPEMCMFLTPHENNRYKRTVRRFDFMGAKRDFFEISELTGVPVKTIRSRYYHLGYSIEEAANPDHKRSRNFSNINKRNALKISNI